jgi:hypothetical protein
MAKAEASAEKLVGMIDRCELASAGKPRLEGGSAATCRVRPTPIELELLPLHYKLVRPRISTSRDESLMAYRP